MMKTITVSKSTFDGGQKLKLNIKEQHPISYNNASKQFSKETIFSSPYLSNSQTIPARQIILQNRTVEDNEINIFDAQKYFNEGNEQYQNHTIKSSPVSITEQYEEFPRYSSVSSSVGTYSARNYPARSFYATPTASSEASWNSQTGLLSNPPGTIKVSLQNLNPIVDEKRKYNNSPRWFFRRNCPCIGKKSIQVDDKTVASEARSPIHFRSMASPPNKTDNIPEQKSPAGKSKNTMPNPHRVSTEKDRIPPEQPALRISLTAGRNFSEGAGFSFPILKPSTTSQTVTIFKNHSQIAEEPPRDSLEVFHPSNHENPGLKTTSKNTIDDDGASDGSSDLFELESFSTQTTYPMYNNNNYRRDSLDEAANFRNPSRLSVITSTAKIYRRKSLEDPTTPSVAPTEGYEPSEASIDWSVTTAEGFDRASVTTFEDMMALTDRHDVVAGSGGRKNSGSRGNGLMGLSCRSEKAVLVGPGLQRVGPAQATSTAVPQQVGNWAYNKPPFPGRPNETLRL